MQSYYTHLGQTQVPCKAGLVSSSVQHQLPTDFKQGETQEAEFGFSWSPYPADIPKSEHSDETQAMWNSRSC